MLRVYPSYHRVKKLTSKVVKRKTRLFIDRQNNLYVTPDPFQQQADMTLSVALKDFFF